MNVAVVNNVISTVIVYKTMEIKVANKESNVKLYHFNWRWLKNQRSANFHYGEWFETIGWDMMIEKGKTHFTKNGYQHNNLMTYKTF